MSLLCPSCREVVDEELTRQGLALHPTCEPLQTHPDMAASEVFTAVGTSITQQPRSLQRRIGPSELGVPCDRRIAYKLGGVAEVNDRGVAWKPYVGTCVHEAVANTMAGVESDSMEHGLTQRWHVEERVNVGAINGADVTGSCDLFDAWAGGVWDHKFTTRNKIRETYKPHGPGDQYRTQAHLYGRGWQRAGHAVRTVGIIFWTRDGEFTDRHVWWEPYDEQVAIDALERASQIAISIDALGPAFTIEAMPTGDAYCNFCPWFRKGSTQLDKGCPGHPTAAPNVRPSKDGPAFGAVANSQSATREGAFA